MAPHHPARRIPGAAARPAIAVIVLALGIAVRAAPVRAQASFAGELAVLAANVVLGGTTAGVAAHLGEGTFLVGLADGAAGGAAVYAGKRLSTADVPGAGLAGRALGAVGASVVRNAAAARDPLERVIVPVGPVSVYFGSEADGAGGPGPAPKLHLGRGIFLAYLILNGDYRIDWARTFSAGTPVFRSPELSVRIDGGRTAGGLELLGAIMLADSSLAYPGPARRLVAHERVHAVQDDFATIAWTDPMEDWLLDRMPGGETVRRYIETDVPYAGLMLLGYWALPYRARPWEIEARYLDGE